MAHHQVTDSANKAAQPVPPSYLVHRRAAFFQRNAEWHAAPVFEDGSIDWPQAESVEMPDLLELAGALQALSLAMTLADNL
jgi:hypothetical protein